MAVIAFTLSEAARRLKRAAREVVTAHDGRPPGVPDRRAPVLLAEMLEKLLAVIVRLDREEGEDGPIYKDDVNQLGDRGMNLVADLVAWAKELDRDEARKELEIVALAIIHWIMRHHGELRTLEPVVNALANFANRTHDPETLVSMADFMGRVIQASSAFIKQDLEKTNPGRPWRLLHLNRGIVATRSHNPALMEQVFEDLVRFLPEEAPTFFADGMQQMEELNYPRPVREVIGRFFDAWTRPRMH